MIRPNSSTTGPNIAAVARAAGVSKQTISNALNAPERLHPATLLRVQRVIDELGYEPNRAARSLRTHVSRQIGYRIDPNRPHWASAVMDEFLHALAESAQGEGYSLLLFTPRDTADELTTYAEMLRTGSVDGFVLSGVDHGDERPGWLRRLEAPFASFGRVKVAGAGQPWVDVDGEAGVMAAVDHLVDRGHRRIAFLGWPTGSAPGECRVGGWRRALRKHELPGRAAIARAANTVDDATAAALRLLDAEEPPTAVVAASDVLALGCFAAARQRGMEVGRDLAVIGFDDSPAAELAAPALTSIRQPLDEVGRSVIRMIVGQLSGARPPRQGVLLEPTLVVRDSA